MYDVVHVAAIVAHLADNAHVVWHDGNRPDAPEYYTLELEVPAQ